MRSFVRFELLCAAFSLVFALSSCKQEASAKKEAKKPAATDDTTQIPSGSGTGSGSSGSCLKGFKLADAPTYNNDIAPFFKSKCTACHGSGGAGGDLSTYAKFKDRKVELEERFIDKTKSHGGGSLDATSTSTLKAWIEGGMLEDSETSSSGGSSDDSVDSSGDDTSSGGTSSGSSTSSDCGSSDGTSTGSSDGTSTGSSDGTSTGSSDAQSGDFSDWEDIINPQELTDCKKQGKIFDRGAKKCHKADIATSYTCDEDGIVKKFKALLVNIQSQMDTNASDGYQIDQCGEYNGEPIVFFIKKEETNDELRLKIRKICKKNSAACE